MVWNDTAVGPVRHSRARMNLNRNLRLCALPESLRLL
jgi:hypothetical protein